MIKKYLAKILAKDIQGLQVISACCAGAKVKITDIKYLPRNKIFLLSLQRLSKELNDDSVKINSICKFEFVDSVRSKNIDQNDLNLVLELFNIEVLKNKENFDINLVFSDNAYITLSTEIVEVTLEDQTKGL